jgi:hypothetical protein
MLNRGMTSSELRRASVAGLSLLSGLLIFWIALRSSGSDWFISETHADIIYTGIRRFREYPFFSFVFNGGAYLLQDPQSNLYSPAVPLILIAGPSVGLRLMEGVWGALGVYCFVGWMAKRVSIEAALLGGVASVTALGVLWKVAVGNDMFLWHLGLPGMLWAVERVMTERSIRSMLIFGLVLGMLLLGPTFHSFTYLFLPVVPLFVLFQLATNRPKLAQFALTAALLLGSCVLALLIASPKLACWLKFPMSRPIGDPGVIDVRTTLHALFDYFSPAHTSIVVSDGTSPKPGMWGVEESAVAMPPLATLLALVGLLSPIRTRTKLSIWVFAMVLIVCGVTLACSWPIWSTFRELTGGNFRVSPRFLGLAAFGMAVLVALGADVIFERWKRVALPGALSAAGLMLVSAVCWTVAASKYCGASPADTIHPSAINPFEVAAAERQAADKLTTFADLTKPGFTERPILDGIGYRSGFLVVGNEFHRRLWRPRRAAPTVPLLMSGVEPSQVTVSHLRIVVKDVPPHTRVRMREMMPAFGIFTKTRPLDADIEVRKDRNFLLIENHGDKPVDRVIVGAELPISRIWFFVAIFTGLAVALALILTEKPASPEGVAVAAE